MKRMFSCLETTEDMRATQDFRGRGGMDPKEPTFKCTVLFNYSHVFHIKVAPNLTEWQCT